MKVKVKFTGLNYYTLEKVSFTKIYESDTDFTDQEQEFLGHTLINSGIDQADKWIEGLDKRDLIIDKYLQCILNWEILALGEQSAEEQQSTEVEKTAPVVIMEMKQSLMISEQMYIDLVACYSELADDINNLPIDNQLRILLKTLGIGYLSATEAYRNISDKLKNWDLLRLNEPE